MHADETKSNHRFTVKEAATKLSISEAAIRQRIQRESIPYEKDEETGRVYIMLDGAEERLDYVDTDIERELIDTLQEQLRLEREASAELRRIIAGLTQRIPAREAGDE
jgi:ethanolamine ammonia-lyase large subunit